MKDTKPVTKAIAKSTAAAFRRMPHIKLTYAKPDSETLHPRYHVAARPGAGFAEERRQFMDVMRVDPWHHATEPRPEVRGGRSFNPDEFAIALEQVVAGTAPADYRDPAQFFARTCFTRALRDHSGMVLRRLSGKTENTAPVLTLI